MFLLLFLHGTDLNMQKVSISDLLALCCDSPTPSSKKPLIINFYLIYRRVTTAVTHHSTDLSCVFTIPHLKLSIKTCWRQSRATALLFALETPISSLARTWLSKVAHVSGLSRPVHLGAADVVTGDAAIFITFGWEATGSALKGHPSDCPHAKADCLSCLFQTEGKGR